MDAALLRAITAMGHCNSSDLDELIAAMEKRLMAAKTLRIIVGHLEEKNCLLPLQDLLTDLHLIDSELSAETPTLVDSSRQDQPTRQPIRRKRSSDELRRLVLKIVTEHGPLTVYQVSKLGALAEETARNHLKSPELFPLIFFNAQDNTYELRAQSNTRLVG